MTILFANLNFIIQFLHKCSTFPAFLLVVKNRNTPTTECLIYYNFLYKIFAGLPNSFNFFYIYL